MMHGGPGPEIFAFLPCIFFPCIAIFSLLGVAIWIWALVEVLTKESSEGNDKLVWALVVALTGLIGALIYLLIRRPERKRTLGR